MRYRMRILWAALVCCAVLVAGCGERMANSGSFHIVTSFYPMYIAVSNITKDIDGVEVTNMASPSVGCLHDYQLTTEDMMKLENADVFVINGGGMESFLDKALKQTPNLPIIDASAADKIVMLKDADGDNPHVWLSVTYAIAQVKEITSKLCERDPAHEALYRKNALDYVMRLEKLREDMHAELDDLPNKDIVTFHEAFPYLAREFKLNVVAVVEHEPGVEPSPRELIETTELVKSMPVKVLFTEPQYSPAAADVIAEETGARIYTLDPIVTPQENVEVVDAYIEGMRNNADVLKTALGTQDK